MYIQDFINFTEVFDHCHNLRQKIFIILQTLYTLLFNSSDTTGDYLTKTQFFSLYLCILFILYKTNHRACDFCDLNLQYVLEVICCSIFQYFIASIAEKYNTFLIYYILFIHSTVDRYVSYFYSLVIMNKFVETIRHQ